MTRLIKIALRLDLIQRVLFFGAIGVSCLLLAVSGAMLIAQQGGNDFLTLQLTSGLVLAWSTVMLIGLLPGKGGRRSKLQLVVIPVGWVTFYFLLRIVLVAPNDDLAFPWAMDCPPLVAAFISLVIAARFRLLEYPNELFRVASVAISILTAIFLFVSVFTFWIAWAIRDIPPWSAVLGGLAGLFTLVVIGFPIVTKVIIRRHRRSSESLDRKLRIELDCPKCGQTQLVSNGTAQCPSCRTIMQVEVEEPRCSCGYLLYRLVGDQCPECGDPAPPIRRVQDSSAS